MSQALRGLTHRRGDAYTVSLRFWQASLVFALTVRLIISLVFLYQ